MLTRWLGGYWKNRLQGVPKPLDDVEIETMLAWTVLLPAVYPEAVDWAVKKMPQSALQLDTILWDLADSELPMKHPGSVIQLLNHLSKIKSTSFAWSSVDKIVEQLGQVKLDEKAQKTLDEVVARKGLN